MTNILPHIYDLALPELEHLLSTWGQPTFRARQIYRQSYVNLATNPTSMTDLPLALRERLAAQIAWNRLELVRVQTDDEGRTRKAVFRMPDGELIESVLMVYPDRATVCVSTQAGCAMGCVFCATGRLGLLKNLTAGQIVEQVLWAARELRILNDSRHPVLTNIVFMGMGEPFANYDRWWQSVERLHDPQGFNLGARNMTVSTVGLPQGIRRLAAEALPVNLAISLHAPDDELRSAMMPVNQRFPIADLMMSVREYVAQTNRRVSFEYVLLQHRNDEPEQAVELAALLRGQSHKGGHVGLPLHLVHINLIPWNPVPGMPLGRSEWERVLNFQRELQFHGIACTVRVERGIAIAAACGQLAGAPATIPLQPNATSSAQ
jgi:23S rRNA (adenine2503-C2)-methyltransferase